MLHLWVSLRPRYSIIPPLTLKACPVAAAGRQIWTDTPVSQDATEAIDEAKRFLQLNDFQFHPSRNPNSADLLFRCRQTARWIKSGKPLPEAVNTPASQG